MYTQSDMQRAMYARDRETERIRGGELERRGDRQGDRQTDARASGRELIQRIA